MKRCGGENVLMLQRRRNACYDAFLAEKMTKRRKQTARLGIYGVERAFVLIGGFFSARKMCIFDGLLRGHAKCEADPGDPRKQSEYPSHP